MSSTDTDRPDAFQRGEPLDLRSPGSGARNARPIARAFVLHGTTRAERPGVVRASVRTSGPAVLHDAAAASGRLSDIGRGIRGRPRSLSGSATSVVRRHVGRDLPGRAERSLRSPLPRSRRVLAGVLRRSTRSPSGTSGSTRAPSLAGIRMRCSRAGRRAGTCRTMTPGRLTGFTGEPGNVTIPRSGSAGARKGEALTGSRHRRTGRPGPPSDLRRGR